MSQNSNQSTFSQNVPEPEILEPSIVHSPLASDNEEKVPDPIPIEEAPTEVFNESDEDFVEELLDDPSEDDSISELEEITADDSDDHDNLFVEEEKVSDEEKEEEPIENKHDSYECGVCYKTLTMDTNVVTKCNHHFCKDCFYRWIQTNASCPLCRALIDSNAHYTPEQLEMAISSEYGYYMHVLEKSNNLQGKHIRLVNKHFKLKIDTDRLLTRQITLNRLIQETSAITNAKMAARSFCINDESRISDTLKNYVNGHSPPYISNAFYSAFVKERERIQKFVDEFPEIVNLAPKKRKRMSRKNFKITKSNTKTDEYEKFTQHIETEKESHSSKKSKFKLSSTPIQHNNRPVFEFGPPTGVISFNFGEDHNEEESVIGGPNCI